MAELVLLCTVCLVCKVMGGGFEGNDFGNHHCADWHLHLEYFPEIVEAANLSIQLHSGSPGSPLASSSCPLSPGVSNWQPLALTPHRCSSPLLDHMLLHLCSVWSHVYQQKFFQASAVDASFYHPQHWCTSLQEHSEAGGGVGQLQSWITVLTQVLRFSHPHPTAGFSVHFSSFFLFFFSFSTSVSYSSLSSF